MANCPACNLANPSPVVDVALVAKLSEAAIAEQTASRVASSRLRVTTVVLFALSLLTVVPALLVMRLMAKRWGRVDFVLIAVDVFILVLASYGSWAFWPVLVSGLAAVALFLLRHRHQDHGIALGYSGLVITPAMASGALLLFSFFYFGLSSGVGAHLDRLAPRTRSADELHRLPEGVVTRVRAADVRWDEAVLVGAITSVATPPTERWAPLDAEHRVWLAAPADATSLPSNEGVVRPRADLVARLRGVPDVPEVITVVAIGLEEPPPLPPLLGGLTLAALSALLLGLGLAALSIRVAWAET